MKMEAIRSSEKSVNVYQTMQILRYILSIVLNILKMHNVSETVSASVNRLRGWEGRLYSVEAVRWS
jgi:hypothetical protein